MGQPITLQLMKRARNSLQVYPISELRQNACQPSDNVPLSVNEINFSTAYSRLLISHTNQVSQVKINAKQQIIIVFFFFF